MCYAALGSGLIDLIPVPITGGFIEYESVMLGELLCLTHIHLCCIDIAFVANERDHTVRLGVFCEFTEPMLNLDERILIPDVKH